MLRYFIAGSVLCILVILCATWIFGKGEDAERKIYGNPFKDICLSIKSEKTQYSLGEEIGIEVFLKNAGKNEQKLLTTSFERNYRIALFDSKGNPVEMSEIAKKTEATLEQPEELARSVTKLKPGDETKQSFGIGIENWFKITKPGIYWLIAMRHLWSWNEGFVISNMIKIEITK